MTRFDSRIALVIAALLILSIATEHAVEAASKRQVVWLAVIATFSDIEAAALAKESAALKMSTLHLIASEDCNGFPTARIFLVHQIAPVRSMAEDALREWQQRRRRTAGAGIIACEVRPASRIALNVPLLDPSFLGHPLNAVNWTYEDAKSRTQPLPGGNIAIVRPVYVNAPDDVREGLRIGVDLALASKGGEVVQLMPDCIDPTFNENGPYLAVTCVAQTAGEDLLRRITVYKLDQLDVSAKQEPCRNARLNGRTLSCDEEKVGPEGKLVLKPIKVKLR